MHLTCGYKPDTITGTKLNIIFMLQTLTQQKSKLSIFCSASDSSQV